REHRVRVLEVEARVEQEQPVVVLDEHGVRGDPHLRPRDVPHELRVLDDDRAVVEQPDLHRVASSASSAFRTATSFAARSARSRSMSSGVYSYMPLPVFMPSLPSAMRSWIVDEISPDVE